MTDALFDVTRRVIVVTGGLGQLGMEYTRVLLARGARVAVLDAEKRVQAADRLDRIFPGATADTLRLIGADVTSRPQIEAALAQITADWECPWGLINNAAIDSPPDAPATENGPFETYPEESWDRVMTVNVKGVFLCCQVFGGAMATAGRGSIVNIGSIYGVVSPDQRIYDYRRKDGDTFFKPVAYSAAKSSLYNLTRYLSTYWAAKVRVNILTLAGVYNNQSEDFLSSYLQRMPAGRMARADEYNGAVIFLLSDASSYMTGAELRLDGGWTAW
jgi:NAD(P)-dependent dehydrogenase (short-subunit alcohol dehydrogenase family)